MGLIFLLPRCCSYGRPSWSVTRTYCSSSEAFGGAAITEAENSGFKPIKKKKKKVAPREVDVRRLDVQAQGLEIRGVYRFAAFSLRPLQPPQLRSGGFRCRQVGVGEALRDSQGTAVQRAS